MRSRILVLGLLALVPAFLSGPSAGAQESGSKGDVTVAVFRDWQKIENPTTGGCLLVQSVVTKTSGSLLAQIILQREAGAPVLAVRVPNGASLATGIAYRIDGAGAAVNLDWVSCDSKLCLARTSLDAAQFRALLNGRQLELGFRPLPTSRALVVPMSLLGVTAGWNALADCSD